MKIHNNWLKEAYYSDKYITDGILFLNRNLVWGERFRDIPRSWLPVIDSLFQLSPYESLSKLDKKTRTWARTRISRYCCSSGYVILNDDYSYIWNRFTTNLYTIKPFISQYDGPILIYDNNYFIGVISPILIDPENIEKDSFWIDVDCKIELGKFVKE